MTYEELKSKQISTKAQLLEAINRLPDDVKFEGTGPDIGGYDVGSQPYVSLDVYEHKGMTYCQFSTLEADAYKSYTNNEITEEQFQEFDIHEDLNSK